MNTVVVVHRQATTPQQRCVGGGLHELAPSEVLQGWVRLRHVVLQLILHTTVPAVSATCKVMMCFVHKHDRLDMLQASLVEAHMSTLHVLVAETEHAVLVLVLQFGASLTSTAKGQKE